MDERGKVSWSAPEYEHKERSSDWFWALGIIVVASFGAAVIYGNYFFAVLILLAGILLGFFATKPPGVVEYELNNHGVLIRDRLYPYENIKSFWVATSSSRLPSKPTLFIKSERVFMPIISIPIEDAWAEDIADIMLSKNIPEEEMAEHPSEKIMEYFGF
jgi:hypothetical protein